MDTNTAAAVRPRSNPSGLATLLDVTLRQGHEFRRWIIRQREDGWDCQLQTATSFTVSGCETVEGALDQKHRWEADIAAAIADGWA